MDRYNRCMLPRNSIGIRNAYCAKKRRVGKSGILTEVIKSQMRNTQINLNHCRVDHHLLEQTTYQSDIEAAIVSEPYRNLHGSLWITHSTGGAATWACGSYTMHHESLGQWLRIGKNKRRVRVQLLRPTQFYTAWVEGMLDKLSEVVVNKVWKSTAKLVIMKQRNTKSGRQDGRKTRPTCSLSFSKRIFHKAWKRQKLVMLPKIGKLPLQSSYYRPICLLGTMGKMQQRVIHNRLLLVVES